MVMRRLIRTDGMVVDLPVPLTIKQVLSLIGAKSLDTVALHHLGWPLHVMLVDDAGYETETVDDGNGVITLKPVRALKAENVEATRLYHANCRPGTKHVVVGDVVVVPDMDFGEVHGSRT